MSATEDRSLFGPGADGVTLLVATGVGVVVVEVVGDRVGFFGIEARCEARDITVVDGQTVVATDADVLIGAGGTVSETGFGPATTVGSSDGIVAAGPAGRVARRDDGAWTDLGTGRQVRAIDDGFLAAADGVHRCEPGLPDVGLDDAYDVTATPVPRAGTGDGLYRLGNGWVTERTNATSMVRGGASVVYAVIDEDLYRYRDDEWGAVPVPTTAPVVDLVVGPGTYAVTESGTLLVEAEDGWRTHALGVTDVGGLAVASR